MQSWQPPFTLTLAAPTFGGPYGKAAALKSLFLSSLPPHTLAALTVKLGSWWYAFSATNMDTSMSV